MADLFRFETLAAPAPALDATKVVVAVPKGELSVVHEHARTVLSRADFDVSLVDALRARQDAALPAPATLEERVRAARTRLANERLIHDEQQSTDKLALARRFATRLVGQ